MGVYEILVNLFVNFTGIFGSRLNLNFDEISHVSGSGGRKNFLNLKSTQSQN
jgi:hypothetical protein